MSEKLYTKAVPFILPSTLDSGSPPGPAVRINSPKFAVWHDMKLSVLIFYTYMCLHLTSTQMLRHKSRVIAQIIPAICLRTEPG